MDPQTSSLRLGEQEAERLKIFISGITDYAIYMLSSEGHVASWNAGAERFKGYSAGEIIGQHFSRFYTPEDRATGLPARALATATSEGKFEAEGWRVRKDGSRFWASVVIDPIRDASGTLLGFAKITRDITAKRQAQQALRDSEDRFRMLVQGVTDYAIYMLSADGTITNWNAGARRIKGYADDEVIGTHFSRFYTPEDLATGLPARALHLAATQGRFEAEGWRTRKDGSRFWAHVVIDPIRSEQGELIGFAKITRDITERREAAEQLEKTREALYQSQKLEALGKLTGGVAHDFNNLLTVLTNGMFVLRQRITAASEMRTLEMMEQAVQRGAALTQQLLSFSRQQPLKPEPHDLDKVIASFEPVLRRARRSGLDFEVNLAGQLPLVMIDTIQLETALLNLVVNASDASQDGGRIDIRTGVVDLKEQVGGRPSPGRYVTVTVRDTGSGMPPDVAARAVEPFFTTKPLGQGTGLGLSQVYGTLQQAGGDMQIQSTPGVGTQVTLYFPTLSDAASESTLSVERMNKALIVDDQPEVLELTGELLRSLGYEVLSASSGEEALNLLQRTPDVNLLFSDVVMPGMSGLELARAVRESSPELRIVLASGYVGDGALKGDLEGFEFLPKPYQMRDLIRKLGVA